ncbi:MAG: ATP-dependent zinc metalloprotease FtsH [Planctomycetota bacterium]|nr:ATP-dependent zinc metalloprotease FtsH [Planctomycetota bacterium]MDG2143908.1 ATP-dependent zinc metalloprotease FtsH [Planctomycetota bacterium]
MNETPKPTSDQEKKPRSMGSFLLFLLFLSAIIMYVGQKSAVKPEVFTYDQYLANAYMGKVHSQVFQIGTSGSHTVEGTYRKRAGSEPVPFTATFSEVQANEGEWREISATRINHTVPAESFMAAVSEGWYTPTRARSLRMTTEVEPPKPSLAKSNEESASTVASHPKPRYEERTYVNVIASSIGNWRKLSGAEPTARADFFLPETSSNLWIEVDFKQVPGRTTPELAALSAVLAQANAPVKEVTLTLGKNSGTNAASDSSFFMSLLGNLFPFLILGLLIFFFMRQARAQGGGGGMMNFGKSKATMYTKENRTGVTFHDVAGAAEAKAEVREIVEFLRNPGRFTKIGGRIPRGILLNGSPGVGKTLLAKAIAGEAEVPFFAISGSDFVEMFVGVGASRVRDLFKQARENSPCIIFLDEIDAVGRRRGGGMGGGHDEREQTLNAILVEMDGFGTDDGIILLAATNRPDVLDPALLRPGRFDREVTIDMPDAADREAILNVHLGKVMCEDNLDSKSLAQSTPGSSGADLAAIVNEAAIMAVLDGRDRLNDADLSEARDKVSYGRKKIDHKMAEEDRKVTAYHEAGHAIVAAVNEDADPPTKVTIIPRGRSLGMTMMTPEKETFHQQKRRLVARLVTAFGGRAAEARFCGDISAGASHDIQAATSIARAMVSELGMSDVVGPINYSERQGSEFLGTELMRARSHSEDMAKLIDDEVRKLIDDAYNQAESILAEYNEATEELTRALLIYETVDGKAVQDIVAGAKAEDVAPAPTEDSAPEPTQAPTPDKSLDPSKGRKDDLPGNAGFSPA